MELQFWNNPDGESILSVSSADAFEPVSFPRRLILHTHLRGVSKDIAVLAGIIAFDSVGSSSVLSQPAVSPHFARIVSQHFLGAGPALSVDQEARTIYAPRQTRLVTSSGVLSGEGPMGESKVGVIKVNFYDIAEWSGTMMAVDEVRLTANLSTFVDNGARSRAKLAALVLLSQQWRSGWICMEGLEEEEANELSGYRTLMSGVGLSLDLRTKKGLSY